MSAPQFDPKHDRPANPHPKKDRKKKQQRDEEGRRGEPDREREPDHDQKPSEGGDE